MKRRNSILLGCLFVGTIGLLGFLFLDRSTPHAQWRILPYLDQLVTNLPITQDRPEGWFLHVSKANAGKDYDAIVAYTKRLALFPKSEKDVTGLFNPQTRITAFQPTYQVSSSTDIRLQYTTSNEIVIVKPVSAIAIGGVTSTVSEKLIQKVSPVARTELASFNGRIFPVTDLEKGTMYVSQTDLLAGLVLYKQKDVNVLKNQNVGFEQGLWQPKPDDCSNALPGAPEISSRLFVEGVKEGRQAVTLASKNHFACFHKRFELNLEPGCQYQLSFAYKNRLNGPGSYYLELKPADEKSPSSTKKTGFTLNESMDVAKDWTVWRRLVKPTWVGKTSASIYFYAPSNGQQSVEVDYDDVRIASYCPDRTIGFKEASFVSNVKAVVTIPPGESLLQANVSSHKDLLQDRATFKDGIWGLGVQDCSNQKPGQANISASVIEALGVGKVAAIRSNNHFACISKVFDVNLREDMEYRFSVDARSIKGNKIQYFYSIEGEAPLVTSTVKLISPIAESSSITTEDKDWHTYTSVITDTPPHPKKIRIYLYAPSDGQEIENQYTNIHLTEYQPKNIHNLYFVARPTTTIATSTELSVASYWYGIDRITLHGQHSSLLTNLTQFSPFNRLVVCGSLLSERRHYMLNESVNLWYLADKGHCENASSVEGSLVVYHINGKRMMLSFCGLFVLICVAGLIGSHLYHRRQRV